MTGECGEWVSGARVTVCARAPLGGGSAGPGSLVVLGSMP